MRPLTTICSGRFPDANAASHFLRQATPETSGGASLGLPRTAGRQNTT